jgi:hypothetical protein
MSTNPTFAAVIGSLSILPFLAANAVVGNRIEPFFSLIRPGIPTSAREYVLLSILLVLLLLGALLAGLPMLHRGHDGRRRIYPVNAAVAAFLCLVFVVLSVGLGSDIYRCDVLEVPNCD